MVYGTLNLYIKVKTLSVHLDIFWFKEQKLVIFFVAILVIHVVSSSIDHDSFYGIVFYRDYSSYLANIQRYIHQPLRLIPLTL